MDPSNNSNAEKRKSGGRVKRTNSGDEGRKSPHHRARVVDPPSAPPLTSSPQMNRERDTSPPISSSTNAVSAIAPPSSSSPININSNASSASNATNSLPSSPLSNAALSAPFSSTSPIVSPPSQPPVLQEPTSKSASAAPTPPSQAQATPTSQGPAVAISTSKPKPPDPPPIQTKGSRPPTRGIGVQTTKSAQSIEKPTNARHLIHVAKDPETGGLLLIRGEEVVRLRDEAALASYGDLMNMRIAVEEPDSTIIHFGLSRASPPMSPHFSALAFPPAHAILLPHRQNADDAESSLRKDDRRPNPSDDHSYLPSIQANSSTAPSLSGVPIHPGASSPPDLAKFASPLYALSHKDNTDEVSDSDTLDSLLEEERKNRAERRNNRREKLILEFVRSEAKHAEDLKSVIVDFLAPLREAKILNPAQLKNLFSNIELILSWHMDFLGMLKARLHADPDARDVCFGDVIIKTSVILRQLFAQYNQNYPQAQVVYQELLKMKEFDAFINVKHNSSHSRSNLLTSLYLPIQRMIIYDSLLKEILNLTPPTHPDHDDLHTAYKLIRSMDKAANRVAEKRKNMDTVLRIQSMLTGHYDLAQPHRSYVFEEGVMLVVGKSLKERTMYLFNDLLLVTKFKRKNKYEVEREIPLDKIQLDSYDNDRHLFKITFEGDDIWFHSDNKTSWVQLLNSTIKRLHSPPVEIDDLRVEEEEHADTQKFSSFERELMTHGGVHISKTLLKKKILKWSTMDNSERVHREVRALAKRITQYETIRGQFSLDDSEESSNLH